MEKSAISTTFVLHVPFHHWADVNSSVWKLLAWHNAISGVLESKYRVYKEFPNPGSTLVILQISVLSAHVRHCNVPASFSY
jgi:hypothetical protein